MHRIKATLDAGGNIAAWDHVIVAQSFMKGGPFEAMIKNGVDASVVEGAADMPCAIPNLRVGQHLMDVGGPCGGRRAPAARRRRARRRRSAT